MNFKRYMGMDPANIDKGGGARRSISGRMSISSKCLDIENHVQVRGKRLSYESSHMETCKEDSES